MHAVALVVWSWSNPTHLELHGLQHQVLQAFKQCSVEGSWNQLLTLLPTC